jgi:hypothetical protein
MDIYDEGGGDTTFYQYNNNLVDFNNINGIFTFASPSKVTDIDDFI